MVEKLSAASAEMKPLNRNQKSNNSCPPPDKYNIVWVVLFIQGIGILIPWNMFITANSYFTEYKLKVNDSQIISNTTTAITNNTSLYVQDIEALQDVRKNFLSYVGLAAQLPNLLFALLNMLIKMESGNLFRRVNITLAIESIVFIVTIILTVVDTDSWKMGFFYLTMVSVVILNMSNGIYQNCIFGTGAKFPMAYTNAIMIGSNSSGIFCSVVNLISIWLAPQPQVAAKYYFCTAMVVITICTTTYNLLCKNKYYNHTEQNNRIQTDQEQRGYALKDLDAQLEEVARNAFQNNNREDTFMDDLKDKWQIFLKCWPQFLNVFMTFFLTLCIFPSVIANIKQSKTDSLGLSEKYFGPVTCFLLFNVFATIGNLLSDYTQWPGRKHVWILVALRFAFIPFFLLCNFNPTSRNWPVYIHSDLVYILGNVLFSLSAGYISSLCMMFSSQTLVGEEAQKAGMIAAFFLVFGIFVGVNSSFIMTWLVEKI